MTFDMFQEEVGDHMMCGRQPRQNICVIGKLSFRNQIANGLNVGDRAVTIHVQHKFTENMQAEEFS